MYGETVRNFVIITGMHRSGTSMIAGLLQQAGVHFGNEFIQNHPGDNPKGFYEDANFVSLNNQILRDSGGSWDNPPNKLIETRMFRRRIQSFVRKWPKDGIIGLKDPRCCLTLGIWKKYLPGVKVIFVKRNDAEISLSLQKRNKFTPNKIQELHTLYLISFDNYAKGNYTILNYNTALKEPKSEIDKAIKYIGLKENKLTDDKIRKCIDFKLYRNRMDKTITWGGKV